MALRDIFKINRRTFINPRAWFDYDRVRDQSLMILTSLRGLFTTAKPIREESFAQATERLRLTEEDVAIIAKNYRLYALFFLILSIFAFIYSFYILFRYGSLIGWLLSMSVMALLACNAFRYDFWCLQMRKRSLGLTFADWKKSILGEQKGKPS